VTELNRYWPSLVGAQTGVRDRLTARYDEPHRRYHNRRHLAEVFARIDLILADEPDIAVNRDAVLLAAWFHDAVYDRDGDNEERSAALAERELGGAGVGRPLIDEVRRLVLLTTTHRVARDDLSGQVLCDADLGILAADEERYGEYTREVRREYQHVSDEDFRSGRARILRDLLEAPTLFNTTFAKQDWENRARANIARELTTLEG